MGNRVRAHADGRAQGKTGLRRPRLSYANVVSTLCLFLLLGGGAYAATKLAKNSVGPAS